MTEPKKLIEVAMPVKEISAESVRDKSIRHGHISTLHLWWAHNPSRHEGLSQAMLASCLALSTPGCISISSVSSIFSNESIDFCPCDKNRTKIDNL